MTETPEATAQTAPAIQQRVTRGSWWTVAIVTIATFMLMLDLTVVNVALPKLRDSLQADFAGLQWVIDAYVLTLAAGLLTSGSLADRFGRRRVFTAGFLLFSVASLACGLAGGILTLSIARAVQGIGAAVLFAVGPALIGQEFHGKERGAAFGIFGAGAGLAVAAGPLIGGLLTSGLSWRWIFLINVPIGLVASLLGQWRMRESTSQRAHPVDWTGLITFTGGLTLVVLALLRGGVQGWTSAPILTYLAVGVAALLAFAVIERARGDRGMLDVSLFRIPSFTGLSMIAALISAGCMSTIFFLVSYVQNVLGYSPWETGLRFMPMTGILFVTAAVGGGLTARVPARVLLAAACIFSALGLALLSLQIHATSTWTVLIPGTALLGAGMGLFNPIRAYLAIGVAEPAKAGTASGMNETFQQVGMALGIAALGVVFQNRIADAFAGTPTGQLLGAAARPLGKKMASGTVAPSGSLATPSADLVEAMRVSFVAGLRDTLIVCAAICVLAILVSVTTIRRRDLHPSVLTSTPGVPPEITS